MSLAVIGCGNMSQALVIPMSGKVKIYTYTPTHTRAQFLADKVGGEVVKTLDSLPMCDSYLIACKPQQFDELASELKKFIKKDALVISVMAGVTTQSIGKKLGVKSIARLMPNTPALVGEGVIASYYTDEVSEFQKSLVEELFGISSKLFHFESEDKIDTITGFSGSGPAYIFEFARIMCAKMESMGIEADVAKDMIQYTFLGASKMLVESGKNFETLRNDVTSKAGVTYEALEVFKKKGTEDIFGAALDSAYERAKQLSE